MVKGETRSSEITIPGGRILDLPGGSVQILERGPRSGSPIVLVHCFGCAIDWWDQMMPLLAYEHRVVATDLLGFGGSEKPGSGYSIQDQAALLDEVLTRLDVQKATVVGHSLGGSIVVALGEIRDGAADRLVIVDQAPDDSYGKSMPFPFSLTYAPVIGAALWRVTPDFLIRDGLGGAFAPGFEVPEEFVDEFKRMTYHSYSESHRLSSQYSSEEPLDRRVRRTGLPLLAIFGEEDQIFNTSRALTAYAALPAGQTSLISGAGHSPNVEKPQETADLVLKFDAEGDSQRSRPRNRP